MNQKTHSISRSLFSLSPLVFFSLSVFLGAFLLFQVQPIIGKYILPWFGGSSSVWITAMLFFQVVLLFGYFYAYLITKLPLRIQIFLHVFILSTIAIIIFCLFFIWQSPITPPLSQKPGDTLPPVIQVLWILMLSVGLPYFILSTTSSLLQRWYSQINNNQSPYRLYALSNAGSLIGILSYPFLIEIVFPLQIQGILWAVGFIFYSLVLLFIARITISKSKANIMTVKSAESNKILSGKTTNAAFYWILLPMLSSILLLATTSKITQAVAPVPFLWLVPLGLYLLSFILCFDSDKWYWRWFYPYAFIASAFGAVLITIDLYSVVVNFSVYMVFLFSSFMLLHGELYAVKPEPQRLNLYYFFIALGGAIGGIIVGIIAPLIFSDFWEFYIGILLVYVIAFTVVVHHWGYLTRRFIPKLPVARIPQSTAFLAITLLFLIGVVYFFNNHLVEENQTKQIRNFYGTIGISAESDDYGHLLTLYNGEINHGSQYTTEGLERKPTQYYGENSGAGLAILRHQNRLSEQQKKPIHIGVVGLGIGTLATYGEKGDRITFYEINPAVIGVANEDFTYLKDSRADITTVLGDARLSMEKELAEKNDLYDVLLIDAFTDDAIPVHLLTQEAFGTYLNLLDPANGILAVHISNRYLDLYPVVQRAAQHYNLSSAFIESSDEEYQVSSASWVLLSRNPGALSDPEIQAVKSDYTDREQVDLWTDDYSNLFQVLDL